MNINGNYSQPVMINGYQCWNCAAVADAKKGINPQHPKSGPYGIDAAQDPSNPNDPQTQQAVTFGGSLTAPSSSTGQGAQAPGSTAVVGGVLDLTT